MSDNQSSAQKKVRVRWRFRAFAVIYIFVFLGFAYYFFTNATVESFIADVIAILPYVIVGGISGLFAILDLYERFPDFGIGLPLATPAGWLYLFANGIIASIVLFAYITYLPLIGDVWTTSVTIAFTYPLLIRSKFFTIASASGEKISAGPELLFDRLQSFLSNSIISSTGVLDRRRNVIKTSSALFNFDKLKEEACLLIENRTDWSEEKRMKERERICNIENKQGYSDNEKEFQLAKYILEIGGERYLVGMTNELTKDQQQLMMDAIEQYHLASKPSPRKIVQEAEFTAE